VPDIYRLGAALILAFKFSHIARSFFQLCRTIFQNEYGAGH